MTDHVVDISRSFDLDDEEPDDCLISDWLTNVLVQLHCASVEISVRIVCEDEMRSLNQRYRDRDRPTNVLSFSSGIEAGDRLFLGDIVVCAKVLREEAQAFGKPLKDHYAHIIIHGLLHLLGNDHNELTDQENMEALEKSLLASLGIPDPYEFWDRVAEEI